MYRDKEASDQKRYVIYLCGMSFSEGVEIDGKLLLGQSFEGIRIRIRVDREGRGKPRCADSADEEDQDH